MRVVFIGRDNGFNRGIIDWLNDDHDVVGTFWIEPDRFSWRARLRKIRGRARRRGWIAALDELAFQIVYRLVYRKRERELWRRLPERFRDAERPVGPTVEAHHIHAREHLDRIRDLAPDVIFSVCTHTLFRPELYEIPRWGTLVLHEGVTPEYRGLHTCPWALINGDFDHVGYTLLRIDQSIDGGPVLSQGSWPEAASHGFCWAYVGHAALVAGLPDMERALRALETAEGSFEPVNVEGRTGGTYTWLRLTEWLARRWSRRGA